jgi:hypothetical protein
MARRCRCDDRTRCRYVTADVGAVCDAATVMNESRRGFAAELYAASHAHDEARLNRLERFRNVEPPTAELLAYTSYVRDVARAL